MNNRNMFYQNTNTSYNNPGIYIPPSGFNMNTEYQAYGPNIPNPYQTNNDIEDRFQKIERQLKNVDTRLQKLENETTTTEENFYML
jgi:hypothetical protein